MSVTLKHKGLPEEADKYGLCDLVKEIAAPLHKLTARERQYLELAIKTCADADYLAGRICAFWMRVSKIAKNLVCTTRQVNSIEKSLESKGLICRTTGRNGTRYVVRNPAEKDGAIELAVGINLAPLIEMYDYWLKQRAAENLLQKARKDICAEIQNLRRRIYASNLPDLIAKADVMLPSGRTSRIEDVERLKEILGALQALLFAIESKPGVAETSDANPDSADAPEESGSPKIQTQDSNRICIAPARKSPKLLTARQAVMIASPRYQTIVNALGGATLVNIVEASDQIRHILDIDQKLWGAACKQFGREGAALCVLAIDRNRHLPINHERWTEKPGGALVGIIRKARSKGFNLNGMLRAIQGYPEGSSGGGEASLQRVGQRPLYDARQIGNASSRILANVQIMEPGAQP